MKTDLKSRSLAERSSDYVLGNLSTSPETKSCFERHEAAIWYPKGYEKVFVSLTDGIISYIEEHKKDSEGSLAEDYVLGPPVKDILESILQLLNGPKGRLDGGIMDSILREVGAEAGFVLED
jgi:hypothetical protein